MGGDIRYFMGCRHAPQAVLACRWELGRGCLEKLWLLPIHFARVMNPYESIFSQACRAAENGNFRRQGSTPDCDGGVKGAPLPASFGTFLSGKEKYSSSFFSKKEKKTHVELGLISTPRVIFPCAFFPKVQSISAKSALAWRLFLNFTTVRRRYLFFIL